MTSKLGNYVGSNYPYYMYQGSANVPGCNDKTLWVIIGKPIYISTVIKNLIDQLFRLNTSYKGKNGNARDLQDLGDRKIKKGGEDCDSGVGFI